MDKYKVTIQENRKLFPDRREECLFTMSSMFETLKEVIVYFDKEFSRLRRNRNILREWDEIKGDKIVKKFLFKDNDGRILHKYEFTKVHIYDDNPFWDD